MTQRSRPHRRMDKMASSGWKAAKTTWRHVDGAASALGRWATTDHTGFSESLSRMPLLGFWLTVQLIAIRFVLGMLGALLSGLVIALLIAYGIPYFLFGSFP